MTAAGQRACLASILHEKSYLEGDFTLASGRKSNYYFDCRQSSLHPAGASLIGSLFLEMMLGMDVQAVAGMTMGGDPLVSATSLAAFGQGRFLPALIVRKEAKGHGTTRSIEGLANVTAGDSVLVLEDVVSSGGSVLYACRKVEEAGFRVPAVFCILDREEGGAEALAQAGYPVRSIFTRNEIVFLARKG
ncbi:MAG: orotate phosphoribosyltransferase [Desulfovibrio sp.]|jgi:orotate phosphoribosyltransferase|nr:orotate phosphoribosyltransferase [Desulfovibrio sp.]